MERDYIAQDFELPPGQKAHRRRRSQRFGAKLQAFYGGRIREVLAHPRFACTSSPRAGGTCWAASTASARWVTLGAFVSNTLHRKAKGAWLERVVFSAPEQAALSASLRTDDFPDAPGAADRGELPATRCRRAAPFPSC